MSHIETNNHSKTLAYCGTWRIFTLGVEQPQLLLAVVLFPGKIEARKQIPKASLEKPDGLNESMHESQAKESRLSLWHCTE